ncbi:peptidoglycan synthetase [Pedobacter sp. BS3]|uniref:UDP-N-acetylmuramate--L-alanine ligase n=1 Tax=Pedobacter sp. BS3 TaxID=2567937 RepID=UPI0011EFE8C7|nr:Mur ligase family protein [Pedobacter sp. BS3]TZF84974.1 peptidoglycan synthetase [Pedobacter sp. BS3]
MFLHFIAIGGSAMHNLAIALKKKGYTITGSDDEIVEPSASRLAKYGLLPDKMGWDVNRIHRGLDGVILGMHARVDNPELLKALELGVKVYSYPEYIYEQSRQKKRVVIGGSHGKTTITSMVMHVLQANDQDFDYLVGAQLAGFDTMVKITEQAPVMIIEGDEYLASAIDRRPKFHLYHADIGVISGIAWDHINVFPTFEDYEKQFSIFIDTITENGTLIYCKEDEELVKVVEESKNKISKVGYGVPDFIIDNGKTYLLNGSEQVKLQVFGKHNLLNINAAKQVCAGLGITGKQFYQAIQSFKGAARRLELLGENQDTAVYKDFAHSPSKLKATLTAVKEQYPGRELVAVIELHTFSSLNETFLKEYAHSMDSADVAIVYIDDHTFEHKKLKPYDENTVKQAFANDRLNFFNNIKILERFLTTINHKGKNLLLMSSGSFSGMDLNNLTKEVLN